MPFDLIHRHDSNAAALTIDQLRDQVPAAFSETAAPETSERYGFVHTASAIDILTDHGFAPVRAIQKPSRKAEQLAFADHMITFAPQGLADTGAPDRAEIVLYNSHNGKSALKLFAGSFRFICSNGMVAGDGFEAKARHSRLTANGFSDMVADQAQALPDMMQRIERMKQTPLEREQIIDLAYNATKLRWDMESERKAEDLGSFATSGTVSQVNRPRRYGDQSSDLWTTFNVAQEALIRGGVRVASFTKANPQGSIRKARPVASLPESIRINRQLWDMANAIA